MLTCRESLYGVRYMPHVRRLQVKWLINVLFSETYEEREVAAVDCFHSFYECFVRFLLLFCLNDLEHVRFGVHCLYQENTCHQERTCVVLPCYVCSTTSRPKLA